jgi:hypothetical protein
MPFRIGEEAISKEEKSVWYGESRPEYRNRNIWITGNTEITKA